MTEVTSAEFQQKVGLYSDLALQEPVIITSNNRNSLVLMGIEEYEALVSHKLKEKEKLIDSVIEDHKETLNKLFDR